MAAAWLQIYPAPDSLAGNNYPPLSFYAVGILGKLTSVDNLFVGRWLSFVALGAVAFEIYAIVRLLSVGRLGAVIAALWYLAIMAHHQTQYVGANDPQLAGLAIMGAGLLWFLRRVEVGASPTPALLLMVAGGFWKHNNIAIPLSALAWLYIARGPCAYRATLASLEAVTVALAACVLVFGVNFIPDLLASRQYALSNVVANVGHLQWSALAFGIWASWAVFDRSRSARFTALHVGVALVASLVQWSGHGVFGNAEFDLLMALAIGIGVTFNRLGASWLARRVGVDACRDALVIALLLRLLATDRQETALLLASLDFRQAVQSSERKVLDEAAAVSTIPGDVACFIKLVCRRAGKRYVVDDFKTEEMVTMGKTTPAGVVELLQARGITWYPSTEAILAPDTSLRRWAGRPK
ncbi:hypothetical protein [Bradyrhizobium niftali]|uniref:hypothetical protein n=1 Tax=Bradyrhizobium niftali TaxID=2560055 RepID=UPI00384A51C5